MLTNLILEWQGRWHVFTLLWLLFLIALGVPHIIEHLNQEQKKIEKFEEEIDDD